MNLSDEFLALITSLQGAQIEFAVCGGLALALHGVPRFTNDIDLLILPGDLGRTLAVARKCGFEGSAEPIRLGVQSGHPVEIQRINKYQQEDFLTLDLVLVGPVLEDVWQNRMPFQWHGRSLLVVSASGLAKMKLLAGRPQDFLDIQALGFATDDPSIQS